MTGYDIARGRGVWALALGQTLAYACIYYIFAALVLALQDGLGWEKVTLALGPTLAIIIAAISAPLAGQIVDRGYGQGLLTGGALLGAISLVGLSASVTQSQYLMAWAGIGLAQGACLYEVCFAILIRRLGPDARAAIVRVTLVAGFASTLAFPAGAALAEGLGWRGAVLVAAGVMILITAPLNLYGAAVIRRDTPPPGPKTAEADRRGRRAALRSPGFWLLAVALSMSSLNHWMIVAMIVPIFVTQGASTDFAVLAAACVGPAQVAGRLLLLRYEARIGTKPAMQLTVLGSVLASLILLAAGLAPVLVLSYAILQGAAVGIATILRPVLIAEVMGPEGYGTIAGMIQIPALLAGAAAPVLGAAMLAGPGVSALMGLSLVLSCTAFLAVVALRRMY